MTETTNKLYTRVLVDGEPKELGGAFGVEDIRAMLQEYGIQKNIADATVVEIDAETIQFDNPRGENGLA